jgi:imidazoleglycerol-phosphate dehydratase
MTEPTREIRRTTRETTVRIVYRWAGSGHLRWEAPDPLVAHLVEALTRYAGLDLQIDARGDDPHHVVEDVALTFGRALRTSLPTQGIRRFGSATLPMDEALVGVSLDLIDRSYYRTDLPPTSLAEHFLRSWASEAKITYHQWTLRPGEPHHLLEATFKATGVALTEALSPARRPISTKGKVRWSERP